MPPIRNLDDTLEVPPVTTRPNWRRLASLTLQHLRHAGLLKRSIVVLVGSYARGTAGPTSDVDLLVLVSDAKRPPGRHPLGVHLSFEDIAKVPQKVAEGDDYLIAALKFGKVIYDGPKLWGTVQQFLSNSKWPDWQAKLQRVERRAALADELLKTDDVPAAAEEYLAGVTQLARAVLLRHGVYPLSRAELPAQLVSVAQVDLADTLRQLIDGTTRKDELHRVQRTLHTLLAREKTEACPQTPSTSRSPRAVT